MIGRTIAIVLEMGMIVLLSMVGLSCAILGWIGTGLVCFICLCVLVEDASFRQIVGKGLAW